MDALDEVIHGLLFDPWFDRWDLTHAVVDELTRTAQDPDAELAAAAHELLSARPTV
jgi:hypothetical protein